MMRYIRKTILTIFILSWISSSLKAITIKSVGSGNFTTTTTWDCGCVPLPGDSVTIVSPHSVSITSAVNVGAIWVKTGATLTKSSTVSITSTLTIDGAFTGAGIITFNGPHVYFQGSENPINVPGNFVVMGTLNIPSGTIISNSNSSFQLQVGASAIVNNSGIITLSLGTISVPVTSIWRNLAGSSLTLGGNLFGGGTVDFSGVGNTVNYSTGPTAIGVPTTSYYNLTILNNTKTLAGNITVAGNFTINPNTVYDGGGFIMTLGGNWINNTPNYTSALNADVTFNGTASQTIVKTLPELLRNVTVATTGAGKLLLTGTFSVTGNLTINAGGVLDVNASNQQLTVYGNWTNNGGTFIPHTGTVYLAPGGATTLGNTSGTETFYNLQKINPGTTTLTSNIQTSAGGLFTLGAGTFNASSFNITTGTSWYHLGGTWNPGTGTVILNGPYGYFMTKSAGGTESFYNFTVNMSGGGCTMNNPVSIANNLNLTAGYLDVKAGSNNAISVAGNVTINGQLIAQNGTFTMNGSSAQTMDATAATTFYNFTSSNAAGVSINSGTYTLNNCLTSASGQLSTAGATSFTLPSTAASTAYIGTGAGTYGGTFILQRYITGRTAHWQDFAVPVSNTTLLDWDNEMYMSGVNGPDGYAGTFRSVNTWSEPSEADVNVTSEIPLVPMVGYEIWTADDLSNWNAKFIDSRGTPNSGNQTVNLSYTAGADAGDNRIGNPYASHITWNNSLGTVGVQATIYVLQNGNYVGYGNGTDIPSHQGFIAYASAGSESITFTEACKAVSTSSSWGRQAVPAFDLSMKLSSPELTDYYQENFIEFNDKATAAFDVDYDHRYIKSPEKTAPVLYMVASDGKRLTRNAFSASANETTVIPVKVAVGVDGVYKLETFGASGMVAYSCALLEDLKEHKIINLIEQPDYSFSATTADSPDRFVLHLTRKAGSCESVLTAVKPPDAFYTDNQVFIYSANGSAFVKFDFDQTTPVLVSVYDMQGRVIMNEQSLDAFKDKLTLALPDNAAGLYMVNVNLAGNHMVTKKIFVSK